MKAIGIVKHIDNGPSIALKHIISHPCIRVRHLALNNQVRVRVRLHMFYLMATVIHKPIPIGQLRICFSILNRQLSVITQRSTIIVSTVNYLHLSVISRYSSNYIEEDQTTNLLIVLCWPRGCIW